MIYQIVSNSLTMQTLLYLILFPLFIIVVFIIVMAIVAYYKNPFSYPPDKCYFWIDVTNCKELIFNKILDNYIYENKDIEIYKNVHKIFLKYINIQEEAIGKCFGKRKKEMQLSSILNNAGFGNGFKYIFVFYKSSYNGRSMKAQKEKVYVISLTKEELTKKYNELNK